MSCGLLLFVAAGSATENYDDLFNEALRAVDFEFARNWAYTETSVDEAHVRVGRFDPRRAAGQRWQLVSIDNRKPTQDEVEEYVEEQEDDRPGIEDDEVVEMVEPGSVFLIEETDQYWLLGFKLDDDDEALAESIDATIRINRPGRYLEFIDVHNRSVIKPAFGVTLTKLITRFTFGPAAEAGPVVPLTSQVEVSGKAMLFISFDEQQLSRNSDFEYAGGDR